FVPLKYAGTLHYADVARNEYITHFVIEYDCSHKTGKGVFERREMSTPTKRMMLLATATPLLPALGSQPPEEFRINIIRGASVEGPGVSSMQASLYLMLYVGIYSPSSTKMNSWKLSLSYDTEYLADAALDFTKHIVLEYPNLPGEIGPLKTEEVPDERVD